MAAPDLAEVIQILRDAPDDRTRAEYLGDSEDAVARRIAELIDTVQASANANLPVRRLLWILRRLALQLPDLDLAARADYALARRYALSGRPNVGLALLDRARDGWSRCGRPLPALRTNLGRMQLLTNAGAYQQAIAAGRAMLEGLTEFEHDPAHAELSGLAWLNIAACENFLGRFRHALQSLRCAEHFLTDCGNRLAIAQVCNNRGGTLKDMGHVHQALACFEAARQDADPLLAAQLTAYEGEARLLAGQYQRALRLFEQARGEFARLDATAAHAEAMRAIAETYLSLNLYPEALAMYERILPLLTHGGMTDLEIRSLLCKAKALGHLKRTRKAIEVLRRVVALAGEAGNGYLMLLAYVQWAELLIVRGDRAGARELLSRAELTPTGPAQQAMLALARADVAETPDAARKYLRETASALARAPLPFLKCMLLTRRGALLLASGQSRAAIELLREAVRLTEALRRGISHEPLLRAFFDRRLEPYHLLIEAYLADGLAEQALLTAEQSKARTLLERQPAERAKSGDLRWLELSHIQQRLLEGEAPPTRSQQRRALLHAEQLLGLTLLEGTPTPAASGAPAGAAVDWPAHPVVVFSQNRDSLIYFLCRRGRIVDTGTLCGMDALGTALADLRDHMDRMAGSPLLRTRHAARMLKHVRGLMGGLYREVFAPIDARLGHPRTQRLTLIPHGILAMLPFGALHDGDDWLVGRYCFTQSPALGFLSGTPPASPFGEGEALIGAAGGTAIPGVAEEVQAVAKVLRASGARVRDTTGVCADDLFSGDAAPGILHLACHGRFRADNPMFSGLRLGDRWVTAAELMERLPRGGRLAVLSACESGRADWLPGNEPLGLPRAFLSAGFHSVVSSLWLADDESSVALNRRFYEDYAEHGDACRALQSAQCAINCDYKDPFYWAGHVLLGRQ